MPMRTLRYGACACQQADKRELALHNPQSGELLCSPFKRASESKEPRQAEGSPVSYFRIERSDIGVTATPKSK